VSAEAIRVGTRTIGDGHPPFVIAEIGYNFTSLDEALRSVDAAADAGADAIKLQTFRAETVVTRRIQFPAEAGGGNQYEEFKRFEISEEVHRAVFARARERGIVPFSTPSHADDVALLERLGVDLYKVGSDDLTNLPLLRHIAGLRKPIIFSSGMATLAEVDEAVRTLVDAGNRQLVLLHCVSNYPIEDVSVVNLRVIPALRRTFPVLVGYSDHTRTPTATLGAVALGAVAIERHFTLDKNLDVPDAFFAADPAELSALVRGVREMWAMLGDGVKRPAATEMRMRTDTRKSLVARRRIRKGQAIAPDDVIIKRPATGIAPRDYDLVLGRVAHRDIDADDVITWDMV
jgi:N,N'-diacetyllegionaminate synthase